MEICNIASKKIENILKEADDIYGFEKGKETLCIYANYIEMKKRGEADLGNYNIFIRNNSSYDSAEKVLQLITKLLNEEGVVQTGYGYLEREDFRKEKIDKKEEILVFDSERNGCSLKYSRADFKKIIKANPDKVFIIVEEEFIQGLVSAKMGDLIPWMMEICRINEKNKMDYINKILDENNIILDPNTKFMEKMLDRPFYEVRNEMLNLTVMCKMKKLKKLNDNIIKKEIRSEFIDNLKIEKEKKIEKCRSSMVELNSMVGIKDVKEQIEKIVNYIEVNKTRGKMPMLHICFEGNPGTGKTTVARIIGKIFKEKKILSENGKFIEAQREDLIGEYVGHTAPKTKKVMEKAKGGVLFIDEAYSLTPTSEKDYGHECISTLIKEMEDKRDEMCVIFAGYTKEMEQFLKTNPGLESRIQFKIVFPDYLSEELYEIFKKFCKKDGYKLSKNIKSDLICLFEKERKKENFSNSRFVRNVFEKVKFEQANRIYKNKEKDMNLINKQDVVNVLNYLERQNEEEKNNKIMGFAC